MHSRLKFILRSYGTRPRLERIRIGGGHTPRKLEAAFLFFRRQLAKLGVESVNEFKSIIRAHQARELRRRQREKSPANHDTKRGENGIMSSMKNRASSTLALTLAIAGAVASPLRSDASTTSSQPLRTTCLAMLT